MDRKPNIILITIDSLRVDRLGCYGHSGELSPRMDRLAEGGFVFDQAITNGSYTKAAFPAILSSTYASMYGGPFHDVGATRPMLAGLLKEHGYVTAGFTTNPLLGANVGYDRGFDVFKEPVPVPETRRWLKRKGAQRVLRSPTLNRSLASLGLNTKPHPVYIGGSEITRRAIEWIRTRSTPPWFLWVHYMDPHWPYHVFEELQSPGEPAEVWMDYHIMWESRRSFPGKRYFQRLNSLYESAIRHVDAQVGRLLDAIEKFGGRQNTVTFLTSDHGEAFYEHDRWQHGAYYDFHEEILRVPLLIDVPDFDGGRVPHQVELLDLAPTILDLAEIKPDPVMEGDSMVKMMRGKEGRESKVVITEMVDLNWYCASLRTEGHKYIYSEKNSGVRELYDLKQDPGEEIDLFGTGLSIETELEVILQRHLRRVARSGDRTAEGAWQRQDEVVERLKALGYIE